MKNYYCSKCGSIDMFIDDRGSQKALMCGDCGKWIKWIGNKELPLVKRFIEESKKDDIPILDNKKSSYVEELLARDYKLQLELSELSMKIKSLQSLYDIKIQEYKQINELIKEAHEN